MPGKTHSKQICAYKTQKALLEFMDDTRYYREPMAWPHTMMSRIRLNAKDYSRGTGDLAVDAFYNLTPDEFFRFHMAVEKVRGTLVVDHNRCKEQLDRLLRLKKVMEPLLGTALQDMRKIADDVQDLCSDAIVQRLMKISSQLENNSKQVYNGETSVLEKMIAETSEQLQGLKKAREVYSEIKILNFDKYANPENPKERRVTSLEVLYYPKMQYPYAFTLSNGWGVPVVTKNGGVIVGEGSTRYEQKVNILLDEKNLLPMLKRVEMFLQAMMHCGVSSYFESVINPPLYNRESENEETVRF